MDTQRLDARLELVEHHVQCENRHDLEAVMATFGDGARYDDEPWGDHRRGRDEVRSYYTELMRAIPDVGIDIKHRHVSSESIVLEVTISGTHLGAWRGLPPTGRHLEFPLCAVYSFDAANRLAGERIYYDRATVLRQLGIFSEPSSLLGRALTALTHPITITRAYVASLSSSGKREAGSGSVKASSKSRNVAVRSSRDYARWLWLLLALFVVRVIAQPLALLTSSPFLPPFESWHSGVLPYPALVVAQLLIIAWLARTAWRFSKGEVAPNYRVGVSMLIVGTLYFAVMLARLVLGLTILSSNRWFSSILPTVFHLVLASYLVVYGHFHFREASRAEAVSPAPRLPQS